MLLLVIVALVATRAFYKTANSNGLHPGKAASAPMLGLLMILAINQVLMGVGLFLFDKLDVSGTVQSLIVSLNGVFVIVAYLAFLRENYRVIDAK